MVADELPVLEGISRIALRLPHDAFLVALVVTLVLVNHVVIAHDIEHLGVRVVDFPVAVP